MPRLESQAKINETNREMSIKLEIKIILNISAAVSYQVPSEPFSKIINSRFSVSDLKQKNQELQSKENLRIN